MKDVIQKKIASYQLQSPEDQLNALKEISQEIILYGLSKTDFFQHVSFQGGTCLRIVHGMDRFSKDLNFSSNKRVKDFVFLFFLTIFFFFVLKNL
ncbi:MAG: nucleotidyl transferase AbiEii/AbiGii toxin family protein [Halobacteriovoraceae bacterium]|nr:nucleotidyl transferase AbiEii/AbiGii toxin family protein [Halobacteriovoraceae bacterium]